jgi:hypothetical protein
VRRLVILLTALLTSAAAAETIILQDGTFVEGKIILRTSKTIHVDTRFGTRTYDVKDIEEIIETVGDIDPAAVNRFSELPGAVKAVLNAQVEYRLASDNHDVGLYERALARLEPFRDYTERRAVRIRIDWLIIEINERLARWSTARTLLKQKTQRGTPAEQIRASAHLDIFEANPRYDLRFVGEKHARNFIPDEPTRNRARQADALRYHDIMQLALEETCEQLLVEDELSVKAFAEKLDVERTHKACQNLSRTGEVLQDLPYRTDLMHAEATLAKAQAILGDYGQAFELDLVRTELHHLLKVFNRLFQEATEKSPETFTPRYDRRSGRLTPDGRKEWRERCDEFLEAAEPLTRLLEYAVDRADRYPHGLRDLRETLLDYQLRVTEMVKAVRKARSRTHV